MTDPTVAFDYGTALLYGIIQGATEFLPVSSSGHLKIAHLAGVGSLPENLELPFDVLLHGASLLAIIIAFFPEIREGIKAGPRFWTMAVIAMVPAGMFGLFGGDFVAWWGESWSRVGIAYVFCAGLLLLAHVKGRFDNSTPTTTADDLGEIGPKSAIGVGLLQVFGLFPGVSRSGSTIVGGLLTGLRPAVAVAFSFLVGLPLIAAAAAKDALDGGLGSLIEAVGMGPLAVACVSCFAVSLGCIAILRLVVRKRSLHWFAAYCALLGLVCIIIGFT